MTAIFINEFHYDNAGSDAGEFVEIAGPAGTDLTGWSVVLYNGNNGAPYDTLALSGVLADLGQGYGTAVVNLPPNGLQNGAPDGLALVDSFGTVLQFLSYEGAITATSGPAAGMTSTDIGVLQDGTDPAGLSLQLTGSGTEAQDFTWTGPSDGTPGAQNAGQSFGSGPATTTYAIGDSQIVEGDDGVARMTFTVTRTSGEGAASLNWTTAEGSATAGQDFAAATGTVQFAEGETAATLAIDIIGDTLNEGPETFAVTISDPTGTLTISQPTATGTIQDNEATLISTIQGNADTQGSNPVGGTDNGDASPLTGQVVTIDAIVVGDFQNGDADATRNLGGFYLQEQDADSDGDAWTSEGIFVFDGELGVDVKIGDRIQVTGTVAEYFGMTQLSSVTSVEVVSSENPLPTAAVVELDNGVTQDQSGNYQADLEAYEGMLVTVPDTLTISEQFQLDRFNEITLFDTNGFDQTGPGGTTITGERPFTYTQFNEPDAEGLDAYLAEVGGRQIVYDDGQNQQNQPIGNLDGFQGYSDATAPSMGDTVTGLTGVMDYQWSGNSASGATWRIRATEDGQNSFVDANPRPDAIAEVAGDIKVASFNVLNFFTSLDGADNEGIGPDLNQQGRGADSPEEYQRQLDKLTTAIEGMGAHVIGLVELENDFLDPGLAPGATGAQGDRGLPIQAIVDALNAGAGEGSWDWVRPGSEFVGGDAIAGGMIFRTDMVRQAAGTEAAFLTDAQVDPALLAQSTTGSVFDGPDTSRAPLAATFETLEGGDQMTVVVNHFKSKGGSGEGADADQGDGAGAFNNQRVLAAQALDAWLDTNPTGSATPNMLLLGDFNAYASEDPISYLTDEAGFVDLAAEFMELGYSYIFDAMTGTLDYALASMSLFNSVVEAFGWNINADEADALDYNLDFGRDPEIFDGDTPNRASDHDPIVVGISFDEDDSPLQVPVYDGISFDNPTTPTGALALDHIGSLNLAGAEIAAHAAGKLFVTSSTGLQIVDISNPAAPALLGNVDLTALGFATTDITSVATNGEIVAVALPAADKTAPGQVVVLDLDGNLIASHQVGALPDMLTFTPDGTRLLVANEGEPVDLSVANPKGGVSIIDITTETVTQVDFTAFDGQENALRQAGVRIFEGQSVSDDLEPEYISVSKDGLTAMVTLQEANAVAILDLTTNSFTQILPLGGKDFAALQADFSDRDGGINPTTGNPVIGQFMPDAISSYEGADGRTYYVTANEGDDRDDFTDLDSVRLADLVLDPTAFPNAATLQADEALGRLNVSGATLLNGDTDGDGDIDTLLTYGSRSFSILDENGQMIFDSGDAIERIVAEQFPGLWDDGRSDNKGPEPEGVTVGQIGGSTYAFVGLERSNTTLVFDITDPADVSFVTAAGQTGDVSPEGTLFISAEDSPTGEALYVVTNETSATLGIYSVDQAEPAPLPTLKITEAWVGQDGTDVTADWFEVTNTGTVAFDAALNGALHYDDDSADPASATTVAGIPQLQPGQTAIVVIGTEADAQTFRDVWGNDIDLSGVQIGWTDGAGLGQGGDAVTIWMGNPAQGGTLADSATIPALASGVSYDANLGQGSTVGNAAGAVATDDLGGIDGTEPAVGSPGQVTAPTGGNFLLELLHFSDQEASTSALADAPNLSAVLNALRAQDLGNDGVADNTLTLSSGDAIIGSPFFDASEPVFGSRGIADIQIQNELGIDAMALGNHEFDFGTGTLAGLISGDAPGQILGEDFGGTLFPYLSSNLNFATDPNMAPLAVEGGQAPQGGTVTSSVVLTVDSAETGQPEMIGVVGATTPTLDRIANPGSIGIAPTPFDTDPTPEQLDDLAAEIQAEVDALLAANPGMDKVILLSHMQVLEIEQELASRLSGVDVIIAGGSNTRLFDDNDRPRDGDSDQGQYPIFTTDADGNPIAVVNTDGSYKYVGRLAIEFDADGHIIPESYDADVSGAYATDDQGVADLGAEGLVDPEIQQIIDQVEEQIVATQSNILGYSDVFLNGNRTGTDGAGDPDGVRTQETNLGNLTARANLDYARDYDGSVMISIKNGGGIRASIGETVVPAGGTAPIRTPNGELVDSDGNVIRPESAVSQNDITSALAFNNELSLVSMTPAELLEILEHAAASVGGGAFGQFAGISFSFDPALPAGNRVTQADIVDDNGASILPLVRAGEIVADPDLTIRAVTLGFLIPNGDGYPFDLSNPDRVDLTDLNGDTLPDGTRDGGATFADNGTEQDAFAEYLLENHGTRETAFAEADTGRGQDMAIKNLAFTKQSIVMDTQDTRHWASLSMTYDDNGTLRERIQEGDDGVVTTQIFDVDGNRVSQTKVDVEDVSNGYITTQFYAQDGNVARVEALLDTGRLKTDIYEGGQLVTALIEDTSGASIERSFVNGELAITRRSSVDGSETIRGEDGNDVINGGTGEDRMAGGLGDDTFVFAQTGFGTDLIVDFGRGNDLLDMTGLGIDSLADLRLAGSVVQEGDDVIIRLGDDSITLQDNRLADLGDDDFFVFAVA